MKYEINLIKVKLLRTAQFFFLVYEVFFFGLNIHNIDHEIPEKNIIQKQWKKNVNKTYINENVENLKIKDYVNNNDDDHNCF